MRTRLPASGCSVRSRLVRPLASRAVAAGQVELVFRQRIERRRLRVGIDRHDLRVGFVDAVIVLGLEADFQCAVDGRVRQAVEGDFRRLVGDAR